MSGILIAIWYLGMLLLGLFGLALEVGLVSEFVGPVFAWILVLIFGIPFAPVLPFFAYLIYGVDGAITTGLWLIGIASWYYIGGLFLSLTDNY